MVLLVAALVSGWSVWRHRAAPLDSDGAGGRPDYLLHDLELVALDDEGKESFTLRAPLMARNPDQGSMEMQSPLFLLPDSEGLYWQVVARSGWVSADGNELRLLGDVAVTGPPQQRAVEMNTAQLNIYPDRDLATAPGAVTITQPGSILRGVGLETNLASKQYKLKSQVRSRYVP
nr:uncharacterized protein YrbK clustered with lipopolysaccharide transporters [uncultured bacterium]